MRPVTGTSAAVRRLITANCRTGYQLNFINVSEKHVFSVFYQLQFNNPCKARVTTSIFLIMAPSHKLVLALGSIIRNNTVFVLRNQ